ncbi:MAG: hypothetical protein ACM3O9_06420, partial [Methylocystaceae bacterium]
DARTTGIDLRIPQVMVVPYNLVNSQSQLNLDGILPAGMVQRYFVEVPPGSGKLNISARVPMLNKTYMGRVRVQLFSPQGQEVARTGYVGYGVPGEDGIPEVNTSIDRPDAGVWEVVVYSTATLSLYGDTASEYSINMSIQEPGQELFTSSDRYLVGTVPANISGSSLITLQIRERDSLRPYSGPVMVGDKTYYVREGRLQVPRPPENNPHIYLTWQ